MDDVVSEVRPSTNGRDVVESALAGAADVLESVVTGTFAVVRTTRSEAVAAVGAVIDAREALQRSTWKVMREVVEGVGGSSHATVQAVESVLLALSRALRDAGVAASALLSRGAVAAGAKEGAARRAA